jgi:toxin HigB-1
MIASFRHRGLELFFESGNPRYLRADQVAKIRRILTALEAAAVISDVNLPGLRLHPLKGSLKDFWSMSVSGNWRIVFRFQNGEARDVDLVDYH